MKKLFLDFETTNTNPMRADILEIGALFVEENKIIDTFKQTVQFNKTWNKLSSSDIKSLKFNNINNKKELEQFNQIAKPEINTITNLLRKIKKFTNEEPIRISGWNNAWYESIILSRIFEKYNIDFEEHFDYHPRDVMGMFTIFHEKFFSNQYSISLKDVHKNLIGTMQDNDFHDSINDCKATLDIDIWIEKQKDNLTLNQDTSS